MGLWDKIKGEFIDVIEWTDSSSDTMVYRFERQGNEIKNGAKLTVRESQMAVFVNEGQFADVFTPGLHTLTTQNLPILTTLKSWPHGFNSPFKAEVYFVNTKNFTDQKWGTKNPITLNDPRFGMVEIRAFGTFATRVIEPKLFLKEIVGTDGQFTTDEVSSQLKSLIVSRLTDAMGESNLTAENFAGKTDELSEFMQQKVDKEFAEYGLKVTKFLIENISMPDEVKKEIFELSRLGKINIAQLGQLKTAKAIEKAAENPSGTAGAGMGMGMGFAMAGQMAQGFGAANAGGPPPLPAQAQYFAAIDGAQVGPLGDAALKQMVVEGKLNGETLIWKQGMGNWTKANDVAEVKSLLGAVPPPLPKV